MTANFTVDATRGITSLICYVFLQELNRKFFESRGWADFFCEEQFPYWSSNHKKLQMILTGEELHEIQSVFC